MPKRKQCNPRGERQFATQLGVRVQFLRLERGLSLRDVAALAGCCVSTLMSIEHGRCVTTTNTLNGIAKALDVQPLDLLNVDTKKSDVGFLLEAMRQHPESVRIINEQLAALA